MNIKKWMLASVATFFVIAILEMIIHGKLLESLYMQTSSVWRRPAEMEQMTWAMWLAYFIIAPVFALIYTYGYQKKKDALGQGLRYGLYMGLLLSAPFLIWYAVLPIPGKMAVFWFLGGIVEYVVAGVAVAMVYRN